MGRHKKIMRSDLAALFSPRRGHFLRASGQHGDLSLDRSGLCEQPSVITPLADELAGALDDVDVVCGPRPSGAPLAELVAAELDATFCYSERIDSQTYRISLPISGDLIGRTVAVVDDVYDSGAAVRGSIRALELAGAVPKAVGALIVLQPPHPRGEPCMWTRDMWNIGLQPACLEVVEESVWSRDECPRCAFGVPLEEVVTANPHGPELA